MGRAPAPPGLQTPLISYNKSLFSQKNVVGCFFGTKLLYKPGGTSLTHSVAQTLRGVTYFSLKLKNTALLFLNA